MLTFPKDTPQFSWTTHIKNKMVFYHLSGSQILRIFRQPERREEGIAENTIAAMQSRKFNRKLAPVSSSGLTRGSKSPSEEIWIMYKLNKSGKKSLQSLQPTTYKLQPSRITMISAWRYPGVTKPGERPPIPEDIAAALAEIT